MLRKQIIPAPSRETGTVLPADRKDIAALATVLVSSELPEHPVDHLFDGRDGPGGSRWIAAEDGDQSVVLAFDTPQSVREVGLETEEPAASRTHVLTLDLSRDGGQSYQEILRQEFTFSPGTTFERERWRVPAEGVTHLRVTVRPDKGGAPARATLTSLVVR
jgi:hypothetical protein